MKRPSALSSRNVNVSPRETNPFFLKDSNDRPKVRNSFRPQGWRTARCCAMPLAARGGFELTPSAFVATPAGCDLLGTLAAVGENSGGPRRRLTTTDNDVDVARSNSTPHRTRAVFSAAIRVEPAPGGSRVISSRLVRSIKSSASIVVGLPAGPS
jgi:hypothetical protein